MSRESENQMKSAGLETENVSSDGIDRRGFLKCMAWAGTGLVWTFI